MRGTCGLGAAPVSTSVKCYALSVMCHRKSVKEIAVCKLRLGTVPTLWGLGRLGVDALECADGER